MKASPSSHRIALVAAAVVALGATTAPGPVPGGVEGFKFMAKFKRGPRIDAAAAAREEEMFGTKSEFELAMRMQPIQTMDPSLTIGMHAY